MRPNHWTGEDRDEIVEAIVDGLVAEMTIEEMRRMCWDALFEEIIQQNWRDLAGLAEQYAPEIYDEWELGKPNP